MRITIHRPAPGNRRRPFHPAPGAGHTPLPHPGQPPQPRYWYRAASCARLVPLPGHSVQRAWAARRLGHLCFPLVLLLLWLEGHLAAKKRELARMKATDL
ncbi:MAG: hypothetical protein ACLRIS_07840 [Flavonifractor plautii]